MEKKKKINEIKFKQEAVVAKPNTGATVFPHKPKQFLNGINIVNVSRFNFALIIHHCFTALEMELLIKTRRRRLKSS